MDIIYEKFAPMVQGLKTLMEENPTLLGMLCRIQLIAVASQYATCPAVGSHPQCVQGVVDMAVALTHLAIQRPDDALQFIRSVMPRVQEMFPYVTYPAPLPGEGGSDKVEK